MIEYHALSINDLTRMPFNFDQGPWSTTYPSCESLELTYLSCEVSFIHVATKALGAVDDYHTPVDSLPQFIDNICSPGWHIARTES